MKTKTFKQIKPLTEKELKKIKGGGEISSTVIKTMKESEGGIVRNIN